MHYREREKKNLKIKRVARLFHCDTQFSSFEKKRQGVPLENVLSITLFAMPINGVSSALSFDVDFTLYVDNFFHPFCGNQHANVRRSSGRSHIASCFPNIADS